MSINFWARSQRTELAILSDISDSHLSEILHRKRGVGKELARQLQVSSGHVLGYPIPMQEWLFNKETKHPAFFGMPLKGGE